MARFTSDNPFVASVLRSRRHDNGRPASRKEVAAALMEMQQEGNKPFTMRLDEDAYPNAKNVLDRQR